MSRRLDRVCGIDLAPIAAQVLVEEELGVLPTIREGVEGTPRCNDPPDRISTPTSSFADREYESSHAVANYRPKVEGRIDDSNSPVVDLLRGLPGVVSVEVGVRADQPTCRIVHLRDWHFVPKDLYALDMKTATGRELTGGEIDRLHRQLLVDVEAVQSEQMALLRCLIKHHALTRLYREGLTVKDVPNYKEKIAVLREMDRTQISELRKQLAEVRGLLKDIDPNSERHGTVKKIEAEVCGLIDGYLRSAKSQCIELGEHPDRLTPAAAERSSGRTAAIVYA